MAGTRKRKGRKAAVARPALGNDPFARGAALRAPAPPTAPAAGAPRAEPTPSSPPLPTPGAARPAEATAGSPAPDAAAHRALDALEARLDAAIGEAEARLAAAAGEGDAAVARAREDLRAVMATLWPALKARLAPLGDVLRLLEPPERLERFGMDPRLVERATPIVEALYATWWRVEARGLEAVPDAGPAVVVANHAGLLPWDALVLRHALRRDHPARRELRPLLDDAACDRPVSGAVAIRLGAVRASPEAAARILGAGDLVGVFPEGALAEVRPWRERYRLGHFGRGGFVKVALRAGAPIVPCAIVGSEEAAPAIARTGWLADLFRLPLLATAPGFRVASAGLLPLPSRWSLRFGPPIDLGAAGPAAAEDPGVVAEAVRRTRAAIQAMLDEDVAARRSVFL
ncbi:MAG: acyltransferase family protein [Anaeromyxobacteraceae bacterium]|nr:acyltransferase family protein [Anaeromyxobacteraceae bacterium]